MSLGIDIKNKIRICLDEYREQLEYDLFKSGINYKIMYDKVTKNNIKETFIYIEELEIEVGAHNDIIYTIQCSNNEIGIIDKLEDNLDIQDVVNKLKIKIEDRLNLGSGYLIERMTVSPFTITISAKSEKENHRITILTDGNNNIYINTISNI